MRVLYPLKFKPILIEKIWGGNKLREVLNKQADSNKKWGESWEISGVQNNISVVENGFLKDNSLEELIEVYMGDLVGEKVYDTFGVEFPLLIKFIDANDFLSIQVHPDNDLAKQRHNSYGKTEMWYIVDSNKNSKLIDGFNQEMNKTKYLQHFKDGTLRDILNFESAKKGDAFFMPAGRIHATGPGILFAEIQQTSDITYRIYDWERTDTNGNERELHTDLAVDAIDYAHNKKAKTDYKIIPNISSEIISCQYFKTNIIELDKEIEKDYSLLDSFIIYMAIEGETNINYQNGNILIKKGETVLIPAVLPEIILQPKTQKSRLLEVYI